MERRKEDGKCEVGKPRARANPQALCVFSNARIKCYASYTQEPSDLTCAGRILGCSSPTRSLIPGSGFLASWSNSSRRNDLVNLESQKMQYRWLVKFLENYFLAANLNQVAARNASALPGTITAAQLRPLSHINATDFQCCGSGMFNPDPDFCPSRISDPGFKNSN